MPTLVKLENVNVSAGDHTLLRSINLHVKQGDKIALVGPSGSGKTTLLHHLYKQLGSDVALCPQQLGLVDALSVYHNIYMGQLANHHFLYNLRNLLLPIKKHWQEITRLHELMQLTPQLQTSVARLSGGERQRVAIARALYSAKTIFFGDEPISHLDPKLQQHVLNLLLKKHHTVIIALHDPLVAHTRFDRLVGLRAGRILFDAASRDISLEQLQKFYLDYHE